MTSFSLVSVWTTVLAWLSWLCGVRTRRAAEIGRGRTVVVVGGGFAGVTTAHYLAQATAFEVVLFDKKDYFEFTPSMLRVLVEPDHARLTNTAFAAMPMLQSPRIRLVQQEVTAITDQAVQGKDGEWVKYDSLVLAMGSDYHDRIKPDDSSLTLDARLSQVQATYESIAAAPAVNIFGAGLVGVELAAEIAETWPEKKLTLRSREPHLLPGFPEKAQVYALAWFKKRGIEIVLENSIPPSRYKPTEGELVFNCTGLKPVPLGALFNQPAAPGINNVAVPVIEGGRAGRAARRNSGSSSSPVRNGRSSKAKTAPRSMGKALSWESVVDSRNHLLRVTPELHLVGHDNIFAIGDIMIEDELRDQSPMTRAPKVAYQAELQAWVVSENLKRQEEARAEWRFPIDVAGVPSCPTLVDCSLGKYDGMVIFNSLVITGTFAAINKVILEVTKRWFLRGYLVGELVWAAVDPITLIAHRAYLALTRK